MRDVELRGMKQVDKDGYLDEDRPHDGYCLVECLIHTKHQVNLRRQGNGLKLMGAHQISQGGSVQGNMPYQLRVNLDHNPGFTFRKKFANTATGDEYLKGDTTAAFLDMDWNINPPKM